MEVKTTKKTAILVDGAYYRIRARYLWGDKTPAQRADELLTYCMLHITEPDDPRELYRIFYYDCPPMTRTMRHPLTGAEVDCSSHPGTKWSKDFLRVMSEMPHVAMRMGELSESTATYILKEDALIELLYYTKSISDLKEWDFRIDVKQKGVDMRVGLDVASLSYGRYVDQVVLIAGDSDFLPAIKMARRNGVSFVLDPMKQYPKHAMIEHVDLVESYCDRDAAVLFGDDGTDEDDI